ncbi:MAG: PIN domain-containing protein [Shewanella sp.]|nr:PIN domain-containing protein [Vibrio vulnificus]MCU8421801.1 PIN domain-containing protein [Vibrio vulnificus]
MSNVAKMVIDSNVAIVANGNSPQASINCQLACVELLECCKDLSICLDQTSLIMDEYAKHLSYAGNPGVGDMFFKYLHDNQYAQKNIELVAITQTDDENRGFDELPANDFDPSDRKFLATAVSAGAQVVNATDSDWAEQQELMNQLNITVEQLCPDCCQRQQN